MRVWAVTALVVALGLGGCQTVQHDTASQKPEVTIDAPAAKVKPAVVNAMLSEGYVVTSDSTYLLVMQKPSDNVGAVLMLGSQRNPVVEERVSLSFAEIDGKTRIVADTMFVSNAGTGYEETLSTNRFEESVEMQGMLDGIKAVVGAGS